MSVKPTLYVGCGDGFAAFCDDFSAKFAYVSKIFAQNGCIWLHFCKDGYIIVMLKNAVGSDVCPSAATSRPTCMAVAEVVTVVNGGVFRFARRQRRFGKRAAVPTAYQGKKQLNANNSTSRSFGMAYAA